MEEWADGSEWTEDWIYAVEGPEEQEDPEYAAYPANAGAGGYNGTTTWFAFEEAVEDWLDITELEDARRGPALKARLEGAAYMYRAILN
eukprot:2144831-Amphidinium_carterae.1